MSKAPLMPMATAVWLVENTSLTFNQIATFCNLHEVEVQGIADGEVAKGIVGYNPIISGQLTRDEIDKSSADKNRPLNITDIDILFISNYDLSKNCIEAVENGENGERYSKMKHNDGYTHWEYLIPYCFTKRTEVELNFLNNKKSNLNYTLILN